MALVGVQIIDEKTSDEKKTHSNDETGASAESAAKKMTVVEPMIIVESTPLIQPVMAPSSSEIAKQNVTKSAEVHTMLAMMGRPRGETWKLIKPLGPSLEAMPWYHGFMTRKEAELLCADKGDWLARRALSQLTGEIYCITVRDKVGCDHIPIGQSPHKSYFFIKQLICKEPMTLIQYCYEYGIRVGDRNSVLMRAVHRQDWSLRLDQLKIGTKLGEGEFGDVMQGELFLWDGRYKVAVKRIHPKHIVATDFKIALLREANIMRNLHHKHVLRLYGVYTISDPIMIVLEIAEGNSLRSRLRNKEKPPVKLDMARYVHEIADGMGYLEAQWVVHKDLAARNCLLSGKDSIKISDFGLSIVREKGTVATDQGRTKVPCRWMAPETLRHPPRYSSKSDVWAFGVTVYEIYAYGRQPYKGIHNQHDVRCGVRNGTLRLKPPSETPNYVAEIMMLCFELIETRPSFAQINEKLDAQLPRTSLVSRFMAWWNHRRRNTRSGRATVINNDVGEGGVKHTVTNLTPQIGTEETGVTALPLKTTTTTETTETGEKPHVVAL